LGIDVNIEISILKNPIQEYAWGSRTAIADLLGEPTPSQKPQAELWIGAHPKAASEVLHDNQWIPLPKWIEYAPEDILGPTVAKRFQGKLPFLLKVLAAEMPLSIQAHPNIEQADEGFVRENALQIPFDAPTRNYRDNNHKPELICALTPFWGLKGFRKTADILELMKQIALTKLLYESKCLEENASNRLERFFRKLLTMDKQTQTRLVGEVVRAAEKLSSKDTAFDWVVRLNQNYPSDIGVISPLFLNLIMLQPGEAMFIQAGTLHAYLRGTGIELMANSDNVLRGGLTPKHIDIDELTKILHFTEEPPLLTAPNNLSPSLSQYPTAAEEFLLSVINAGEESMYTSEQDRSVEILICTRGSAAATNKDTQNSQDLRKGTAIIVPASISRYQIKGNATLYKASVPQKLA